MGPVQAIKTCFAKSFQFSGRASRPEFWWFWLFDLLIFVFAFFVIDLWLFGILDTGFAFAPASGLINLLLIIPMTAVTMRRLHDCGWQGLPAPVAYGGIYVAPYAFGMSHLDTSRWISPVETVSLFLYVVILIAALFPGKRGSNFYGPNPNEVSQ